MSWPRVSGYTALHVSDKSFPVCPCHYRVPQDELGTTWCHLCHYRRRQNGEVWCFANEDRARGDYAWCERRPGRPPTLWKATAAAA